MWAKEKYWVRSWLNINPDSPFRTSRLCIIAVITFSVGLGLLFSATQAQVLWNFTPEESDDMRRIEEYMNNLTTMQAKFVQINPDGSSAHGTLYIQRPGFLRFDYDPPDSYLILANGIWLIYVDREMKQVSHIPLKQTLAWFLVKDPISLSDGVLVTRFVRGPGTIRITLIEKGNAEAGSLTLTFGDNPLELKSWSVTDPQKQFTRITLDSPQFGLLHDRELFRFVAPPEWNADKLND